MSYFPKYVFPMIDNELLNRVPNDTDNPYFIMEHVLACRVGDDYRDDSWEEWHDYYIDKLLAATLKNDNLESVLGVFKGKGNNGDYFRWTQYHRTLDMIFDACLEHQDGNEFKEDPEFIPLALKGLPDILEVLGGKYEISQATVKSIFDKNKLPPKRTPLEDRKPAKK